MPTPPYGIPARDPFSMQQIAYFYFKVTAGEAGLAVGVQKATIPKGALILGTYTAIEIAFSGGAPALTVGTDAASANQIITAAGLTETVVAPALFIVVPAATVALAPPLANDQAIFAKEAGGATAGVAHILVAFMKTSP